MALGTVNAGNGKQDMSEYVKSDSVGAANGVAPLNESGKVPENCLPKAASFYDAAQKEGYTGTEAEFWTQFLALLSITDGDEVSY